MAVMICSKCNAEVDPAALAGAPFGQVAKALLTDWRVWAVAVAANVAAGIAAGVLHIARLQAGAGAAAGLYIAMRMRTLRKCPRCEAVSHFALPAAK